MANQEVRDIRAGLTQIIRKLIGLYQKDERYKPPSPFYVIPESASNVMGLYIDGHNIGYYGGVNKLPRTIPIEALKKFMAHHGELLEPDMSALIPPEKEIKDTRPPEEQLKDENLLGPLAKLIQQHNESYMPSAISSLLSPFLGETVRVETIDSKIGLSKGFVQGTYNITDVSNDTAIQASYSSYGEKPIVKINTTDPKKDLHTLRVMQQKIKYQLGDSPNVF